MIISFTSEEKTFTNENGQSIDYTDRRIVIDGTPFKVAKNDAKIFDFQFKDLINQGDTDVED